MAVQGQWYNADGLLVKFGEYYRDPQNFVNRTRAANSFGPTRLLEFDIDITQLAAGAVSFTTDINNDGTLDGWNIGDVYIPAYSIIKTVYLVVSAAFTGGTSIQMGLYQANGTALDASGLMTSTEGAIANLGTIGNKVIGAGTYTAATAGTADWGNHNAFVGLKANGTFTAGKARVAIDYMEANLAPTNVA